MTKTNNKETYFFIKTPLIIFALRVGRGGFRYEGFIMGFLSRNPIKKLRLPSVSPKKSEFFVF